MRVDFGRYLGGAASAALTAFIAYLSANFITLDLGPLEPYRVAIALFLVALWNRFRPRP